MATIYSESKEKYWPLEDFKGDVDDHKVVLNCKFLATDRTLLAHPLPLYLFTADGNPSYAFDLWKLLPDVYNVGQWTDMDEATKKAFERNLRSFEKKEKDYDLILKLEKKKDGTVFLRIVDTIFGFLE